MFCRTFLSPQVKQCSIITYKRGIYELLHRFPNNLRLWVLGNQKISEKCLKLKERYHSVHSFCQIEIFVNPSKKLLKNRNSNFSVVPYSSWKLELVSKTLQLIVSRNLFWILTRQRPLETYFLWQFW